MQEDIVIVTASVDPAKTLKYWSTWRKEVDSPPMVLVVSGKGGDPTVLSEEVLKNLWHGDEIVMRERIDGTINPFLAGIEAAATRYNPKVVACLHDDVEISTKGWWREVYKEFEKNSNLLLAGFGGGTGLGAEDIYIAPKNLMQLARQDFISNMRDAEAHGRRVQEVTKVACLDGFSQIGKLDFLWECYKQAQGLGIRHHAYDSMFGMWAWMVGADAVMIPIECHHAGGVTAVGSEEYQKYAHAQRPNGDQDFWTEAHEIFYEEGRRVLPIRVQK